MVTAYLGLGSNLGGRVANIRTAIRLLSEHPMIEVVKFSSFYETPPVGVLDQPDFVNAVSQVETELGPVELLRALLLIEEKMGRVRNLRWGPRVIDIDILLYDELSLETDEIVLPHPRMTERAFVMYPLAEIAPDLCLSGGRRAQNVAESLVGQRVDKLMEAT